jgi:hypothetical protein
MERISVARSEHKRLEHLLTVLNADVAAVRCTFTVCLCVGGFVGVGGWVCGCVGGCV